MGGRIDGIYFQTFGGGPEDGYVEGNPPLNSVDRVKRT